MAISDANLQSTGSRRPLEILAFAQASILKGESTTLPGIQAVWASHRLRGQGDHRLRPGGKNPASHTVIRLPNSALYI